MSDEERLMSVSHVWKSDSDRWIYIETYNTGMTGLSYMQGDEYELFKEQYCEVDKGLSNFYVDMIQELDMIRENLTEVEFIDKVIWIYHMAEVSIVKEL
tara:strand:- start:313 stop:609 length:297 start_codon:yes stop_codon:yes gene_type:complete